METIVIDSGRQIRVWKSERDLHIGEYAGDGKGSWTATNTLTLPLASEIPAQLVQALLRQLK